ncbi:hypothetical protein F5148DRAFT_643634 [Russula earlei]|uniref:Uncharacterized protein n=1 Tax=Russula earlei TaxID=71964 RepID=A0ACC0UMC5_9AGAM|nr:hypothetical protein F5148DRAFT_643634 [Russula earlei]
MHSLVALPRTFHLSSLQRIESAEPAPRVRRCWLRKHSSPDTSYLPFGVGFVVLFAHTLPIVKLFFLCSFLCKPSFSSRIVLPSLSSSSRGEVDSLHSFLSVSFPLSYSFTLTLLLFGRRLFCIAHDGLIPTSFLPSLILQSPEQSPSFPLSRLCTNIALSSLCTRVIHSRNGLKGLSISCNVCYNNKGS